MKRLAKSAIAASAAAMIAAPAAAELELSFYMGVQSVQDSTISGSLPNGGGAMPPQSVNWQGKPLENPFYYGARGIWWTPNNLGFGLEVTHTKAYADVQNIAQFNRLELSDGHNIITANVMKRWPGAFKKTPKFTPYVGAGLGIAMPHVDAQPTAGGVRTFGYEVTGPAARGIAGLKYDLNQDWALFGEYQVTWSDNDLTIDGTPDGKLSTEIVTHAVNFGVSYSF